MLQKKRKWCVSLLAILTAVTLSGCGAQETKTQVNVLDAQNYNEGTERLDPLMLGEKGYYWTTMETIGNHTIGYVNTRQFNFQYTDFESGKTIAVCNKPECRHDGDEFCTATSKRYEVSGVTMYDGKIYIAAYDFEKADGKRLVLLRLEPDGSALTEVVTLKEETAAESNIVKGGLFIHRGVCFANYAFLNSEETQAVYGTAVYNLIDGTLTQMPEYEYAAKLDGTARLMGEVRSRFMGNDNYVYYNEPRLNSSGRNSRTVLCRYCLDNGTMADMDQKYKNYTGIYTVTEPGKTVTTDKFGNIYEYSWENEELKKHAEIHYSAISTEVREDGTLAKEEYSAEVGPSAFLYYEGKLFAFIGPAIDSDTIMVNVGWPNAYGIVSLNLEEDKYEIWGTDIISDVVIQYLEENNWLDYLANNPGIGGVSAHARLSLLNDVLYFELGDGRGACKRLYEWPMSDFMERKGGFTLIYESK